jgi:hypothetical protein
METNIEVSSKNIFVKMEMQMTPNTDLHKL